MNENLIKCLKNVYKTVDKICLVIVGQPRFIGTNIWEENFVKLLQSTILENHVNIDITYVLPEFDTWDKTFSQLDRTECGLPNVNKIDKNDLEIYKLFYNELQTGEKVGKIKIKKDKIENYIKTKLHFVHNIEFVYYNPYNCIQQLEQIYEKNFQYNSCFSGSLKKLDVQSPFWISQHDCVRFAYYKRQNFFDSLSETTPIIKVRNDYFFSNSTLWNYFILFLNGFYCNGTDYIDINLLEHVKKDNAEVILDSYTLQVLYGNIFTSDYMQIFNNLGFTLYAEEFMKWCFENIIERICLTEGQLLEEYRSNNIQTQMLRKPEAILNKFFMDKCYNIKHLGIRSQLTNLRVGNLYRNITTEKDYYRYNWYEWSQIKINELNKTQL